MSGINARTEYELNAGGEPVKNATYWKRQHDKLADRIAELEKELSWWRTNFKLPTETNEPRPNWLYTPQTKPLSDEEVKNLHEQTSWWGISDPVKFARAIEERHGIK